MANRDVRFYDFMKVNCSEQESGVPAISNKTPTPSHQKEYTSPQDASGKQPHLSKEPTSVSILKAKTIPHLLNNPKTKHFAKNVLYERQ
ncbi:conserved hypothetical protein [Ricinus communis]|uniref:Uncharacterized protein n=1 Tax=Ricinus communis TaxID=3988 RepID=B9RN25_RICCO|nr:conserved hypothetical protein [Ricinus communis]